MLFSVFNALLLIHSFNVLTNYHICALTRIGSKHTNVENFFPFMAWLTCSIKQ